MKEIYFLRCRECGKKYPNQPQSYCEECFAPLEVSYDYEALRQTTSREAVSQRAFNMWRYSEFLPLPQGFTPSQPIGGTPLVKSRKLGEHLGVKDRKSTRLNSSHSSSSYAVSCSKKKTAPHRAPPRPADSARPLTGGARRPTS